MAAIATVPLVGSRFAKFTRGFSANRRVLFEGDVDRIDRWITLGFPGGEHETFALHSLTRVMNVLPGARGLDDAQSSAIVTILMELARGRPNHDSLRSAWAAF